MSIPEWCQPIILPSTGGALTTFFIGLAALVAGGVMIVLTRRRGLHHTAALLIALAMVATGLGLGARSANAAAADECPPGYEPIPTTTEPTPIPQETLPPITDPTDPPAPTPKTLTVSSTAKASGTFTEFLPGGQPSGVGNTTGTLSIEQFDESLGELVSAALTFNYSYSNAYYRVKSKRSNLNLTLATTQKITFTGFPTIAELPAATWIDDNPSTAFTFSEIDETHELTYTPGQKLNGNPDVAKVYTGGDMAPFIGTGTIDATITNTFDMPPRPYNTGKTTRVNASYIQLQSGPRGASATVQVVYTYIPAP